MEQTDSHIWGNRTKPQVRALERTKKMEAEAAELGWQNEPDPNISSLNPFTRARNLAMQKQTDVARALGVKPLHIMRIEQGVFPTVTSDIVLYYQNFLGMPDNWDEHYAAFRKQVRESAPRPINGVWEYPPAGPLTFHRWRTHNWPTVSQMGWAKAFCVHPASLYAIEKGNQKRVPVEILLALREARIMNEEQTRQFAHRIGTAATVA